MCKCTGFGFGLLTCGPWLQVWLLCRLSALLLRHASAYPDEVGAEDWQLPRTTTAIVTNTS